MFGIFGLGPSELIVLALLALFGLVVVAVVGAVLLLVTRDRGPRDGEG
jgi:hypothetical protein